MKHLFTLILLLSIGFSSFGQSIKFAEDDNGIYDVDPIPNLGEFDEGEFKLYFKIINTTETTLKLNAQRLENNVFEGHGNFFCWDLCYDSTGEASYSNIELAANDTTGFAQYIVFRPNNITGYSEITMAFTDSVSGTLIQRTFRFSVNGALSIDKDLAAKALSAPYPNPARDFVHLDYTLPNGYTDSQVEVYNLIGKKVRVELLQGTTGTLRMSTEEMNSGIYFAYLTHKGEKITSRKMVIVK